MRSFQWSVQGGLLYGNSQSGRSHGCVNGSDLASRESNNLRETRHFCINETAVKRIQNHPNHTVSPDENSLARREKKGEGGGRIGRANVSLKISRLDTSRPETRLYFDIIYS